MNQDPIAVNRSRIMKSDFSSFVKCLTSASSRKIVEFETKCDLKVEIIACETLNREIGEILNRLKLVFSVRGSLTRGISN